MLGIMASLFSNVASDSPSRIRLLTKFVESNYEKVDKLLEVRDSARIRLQVTDSEINAEKQALDEDISSETTDAWYLRRLDGGLHTLQIVDYVLAWVIMEDDGIRTHALQMLGRKSQSLHDIAQTLRIFHDNMDTLPETSTDEDSHQAPSQTEILKGLIAGLNTSDVG